MYTHIYIILYIYVCILHSFSQVPCAYCGCRLTCASALGWDILKHFAGQTCGKQIRKYARHTDICAHN